mgnify:CR=1 FL=1
MKLTSGISLTWFLKAFLPLFSVKLNDDNNFSNASDYEAYYVIKVVTIKDLTDEYSLNSDESTGKRFK